MFYLQTIPDELYEIQIEIEAEEEMKLKNLPDPALESVDSQKYLPVYARNPMVQIFVDQQKIKGFHIEKIDTGYGPFYLIPKEDVSMFDKIKERFRDDPRSLNILDARLK